MESDRIDQSDYYYDAFISYRHTEPDMTTAIKLHKALEGYRIPSSIAKQSGIRKIKRVFRDQAELPTSNNLSEDIHKALEQSRYLIVICSPRTPESEWCCEEIAAFRRLHGNNRILSILIEGEPEQAFPASLRFMEEIRQNPDGTQLVVMREVEPLAADIRAGSLREMLKKLRVEKLRLLAPMLGVRFDDLKHRQRERFIKRAAAVAFVVSLFFAAFGIVASIQSNIIAAQSRQLSQKNEELQFQINEKEKQRELAEKNGQEAQRQTVIALDNQRKAEDNAKTAEKNAQEATRQKNLAEANAEEAIKQTVIAEENATLAKQQKSIAEENARLAEKERDKALLNESRALAGMSRQETGNGNRLGGIRLALDALPEDIKAAGKPFDPEAISSLYGALYHKPFQGRLIIRDNGLINDVSYSRDSRFLATASNDCTAKVWDLASGNLKLTVAPQNAQVVNAAVSPDARCLATITLWESSVKIWDMETGRLIKELDPFPQLFMPGSNTLQFSGDGKKLAITNAQCGVMIVDTVTWKPISTIFKQSGLYPNYASSVDFASGKVLFYSSLASEFSLHKIGDGSSIASGKVEGKAVSASISPDGLWIAVCSDKGDVSLLNGQTLEEKGLLSGHTARVNGAEFNRNGLLLTYSEDHTARLWDYQSGKLMHELKKDYGPVTSGKFSPDGRFAATAYENGNVVLWDCATGKETALLDKHNNCVFKTLFSPDGKTLATVSYDNTVRVWDLKGGQEYLNLAGHTDAINSVAFSPDGKRLATASSDHSLRVWDSFSGKETLKISQPGMNFLNARFSRDGRQLMSVVLNNTNDGTTELFNADNGTTMDSYPINAKLFINNFEQMRVRKYIFTFWDLESALWERAKLIDYDNIGYHFMEFDFTGDFVKMQNTVNNGSFSNDGKKFACILNSTYRGFQIQVWDMASGRMLSQLQTSNLSGFNADYVFFSPDASKIMTVSFGLGIFLWDAQTGEKIMKLSDQASLYSYGAFSPDGSMIATACMDGTVCLFDTSSGRLITKLQGHSDMVQWLDFSPDGKRLATVSSDGTATVWRIFPDAQELIDYAKKLLATY